jgi:uncharacterized protein YjbI with pentapeptide repeats
VKAPFAAASFLLSCVWHGIRRISKSCDRANVSKHFGWMVFVPTLLASCTPFKMEIIGGQSPKNLRASEIELKFVTLPIGPYATIFLQTQPVIHIINSATKQIVAAGDDSESVISLELTGSGELNGTTNIKAQNGVAVWNDLIISEVGTKKLVARILDRDISLDSGDFYLADVPSLLITKDDLTDGVYCPRIKVTAKDVPVSAASYCLKQNSDDSSDCAWTALNFPFITHSAHHPALEVSLWFKDEAGEILSRMQSNKIIFGPRQLSESKENWLNEINSPSISTSKIDELLCRVDELTHAQALATANIRLDVMSPAHRSKLSQQLNRIVLNSFGLSPAMSFSDMQKVAWRLMISTDAVDQPLSILDLSQIDLSGRNIGRDHQGKDLGFDFSGSNIKGHQLNGIDPNSWGLRLHALDLNGWHPAESQDLRHVDLSDAVNIPWQTLNANTNDWGFHRANLSNLDLSNWSPRTDQRISDINFSYARNIPYNLLNTNTHSNGLHNSNFEGVDLLGWNPPATQHISSIHYRNATNIPWAALNINEHPAGVRYSTFAGQDLSNWHPHSTQSIFAINYSQATNIQWAAINANTHATWMHRSNFTDVDLSGWNPENNRNISEINYTRSMNMPWTALRGNTHSSGMNGSNFSELDLSGWDPTVTQVTYSIKFAQAVNIPWAIVNARTILGANFTGVNLLPWLPPSTYSISSINYTDASDLPWSYLNAVTHSQGFRGSNFTRVDLGPWQPGSSQDISMINYTEASNIPWSLVNANAHSAGFFRSNFSNTNLAAWTPGSTRRISEINFNSATSLPWPDFVANTHVDGLKGSDFSNVDLSGWTPRVDQRISHINYTMARNIPWAEILSTTHVDGVTNSVFLKLDLTGLDPSGKSLLNVSMPKGARNPSDFEEATGISPSAGTTWVDGSLPWD